MGVGVKDLESSISIPFNVFKFNYALSFLYVIKNTAELYFVLVILIMHDAIYCIHILLCSVVTIYFVLGGIFQGNFDCKFCLTRRL